MNYYLALTDFHMSVISGIAEHEDRRSVVLVVPRGGRARALIRALPGAARVWLRFTMDRDSHLFVSHPFSPWAAAFLVVARRVSFFDDGVAYYADTATPSNRRSLVYRALSARHVRWWPPAGRVSTFGALLRAARIEAFHAVFPDLLTLSTPVVPVDLEAAFGRSTPAAGSGVVLFLDAPAPHLGAPVVGAVLERLHEAARSSVAGKLSFKAHPAGDSRISQALRQLPWAEEVESTPEDLGQTVSVSAVYSFYSSGVIALRILQPEITVVNFSCSELVPASDGLRQLFGRLGAQEVAVG